MRDLTHFCRKYTPYDFIYQMGERYFYTRKAKLVCPEIEKENPDLIISEFDETLNILYEGDLLTRIPTVQSVHNDLRVFLSYTEKTKKKILLKALSQCVKVHLLLPVFQQQLEKYGLKNGMVIPPCSMEPLPEITVDHHEKKSYQIAMLARINKFQKRQHLLLQAFATLVKKYPDWTLHFYGQIEDKDYFQKMSSFVKSHNIKDKVFFEGVIDNPQKELRQSDLFVLSSAFEGFCVALYDAMGLGLPCIGFRENLSVCEMIKDGSCGLLAESGVKGLSQSLDSLMGDISLRSRFGINARKYAEQFNEQIVYEPWEKIIQDMQL